MSPIPPVIGYCGRMFDDQCREAEAALAATVAAWLAEMGIEEAFGPLACGADIVIAEALLARGARLHVVLPFAEPDFIEESVRSGGASWVPRFHACRDGAHSVQFATPGAYVGDDHQYAYNTRLVMGLTALRAQETGAEPVQLAILSEHPSLSNTGLAGARADVRIWQEVGGRTVEIGTGPVTRNLKFPQHQWPASGTRREIRSIIFADYKGFSRLGERELPLFMHEVMGRIGTVLTRFGDHVEFRNTWGDAIYAIVDKPTTAARIALELQRALQDLPPALTPPGEISGMRLGLHYGPIWVGTDRITGNRIWYGGEVNRTARIEPVTPVGGVYCTETFAAALLIDKCDDCAFTSVGPQELAKDFGTVTLYRLDQMCGLTPV